MLVKELSLREIQLAELEILIEFDRICKLNNLKYSLAAGTLLGAIRHKGFIPWDDDIDVCMPRPDYEKFIDLFSGSADTDKFDLSSDSGKNARYPFVKMLNKDVFIEEKGFKEVDYVWIDIFPMDGLPDNTEKATKILKKTKFYRSLIIVSKYKSARYYKGKYSRLKFYLARIYAKLYGEKRLIKNSIKFAKRYPYETAEYIGNVIWGAYGIGERVLKTEFLETLNCQFENCEFEIMSCWDNHLKKIYGDYMQLPPAEKRTVHGIKAYRAEK